MPERIERQEQEDTLPDANQEEQEQGRADTNRGNGNDGVPPLQPKDRNGKDNEAFERGIPWAFWLVGFAILCVTVLFVIVWLVPTPNIFKESNQAIVILSTTFGVIGTLVGTYFGIKTTGDARDSQERLQAKHADTIKKISARGDSSKDSG